MVVPAAEATQIFRQGCRAVDHIMTKALFESAEQAFDSAVHPGAAFLGALVFDAEPPQPKAEQP